METTTVAELQKLCDEVSEDVTPFIARSMGLPASRLVVDSSAFEDENKDITSISRDGTTYINPSFDFKGRERDYIVASFITGSIGCYTNKFTEKGKEILDISSLNFPLHSSLRSSIWGFVACIGGDLQDLLNEQHKGKYNFSDIMQMPKKDMLGNSLIGVRAYERVNSAYDNNDWDGPFQRAILESACGEKDSESVFAEILKKKKTKTLAEYLFNKGIATMSEKQISLNNAEKWYTEINKSATQANQWYDIRRYMKTVEENIRKASYAEIADGLINLIKCFDSRLDFYHPFAVDALLEGYKFIEDDIKKLREYFLNFRVIMRDLNWLFEKHEERGTILHFRD
jgi:hypothetical protein